VSYDFEVWAKDEVITYKTTLARYRGVCPLCKSKIIVGDEIVRSADRWVHHRCAPQTKRTYWVRCERCGELRRLYINPLVPPMYICDRCKTSIIYGDFRIVLLHTSEGDKILKLKELEK